MPGKNALPDAPRAVITGGGSGIGRAFCLAIAKRQGHIMVADIRHDAAAETVSMVEQAGGWAEAVHCDVAKVEDVEALFKRAKSVLGHVDLLINNAGVGVAGYVGDVKLEDWRWVMDINLWGVIYGCHYFVPLFKAQGSGCIINVASVAGIVSAGEMAPYNVTKAGVISLSETLSQELLDTNIGVTVLAPSFVRTQLMDRIRTTSAEMTGLAQRLFERTSTEPEDVAQQTLDAAERGQLYVLPQRLARIMWAMKRLSPTRQGWLFERVKGSRWLKGLRRPPD